MKNGPGPTQNNTITKRFKRCTTFALENAFCAAISSPLSPFSFPSSVLATDFLATSTQNSPGLKELDILTATLDNYPTLI
jgi:hypothetical protein